MNYQTIIPNDQNHWLELRTEDITSTESPALFGLSPYMTPYELWYRKKDKVVVTIEENERMKWGTRLQDSIAAGIAEENKWTIKRENRYIRVPEFRLGTSLDFIAVDVGVGKILGVDTGLVDGISGKIFILEIKNVDSLQFKKEWTVNDDKQIEAPYHIEIQVQHQMLVTGRKLAYIGVLIGGNDLKLIKRTADPKVQEAILLKAAEFWKTIDSNTPPKPDFDTDADFISKLCGYAEPEKVVDLTNDGEIRVLALEYLTLKEGTKINDKRCDSIKAEILVRMGDAEKGLAPSFSISAGMTGPTWIEAHERKGFRRFLITGKKEK